MFVSKRYATSIERGEKLLSWEYRPEDWEHLVESDKLGENFGPWVFWGALFVTCLLSTGLASEERSTIPFLPVAIALWCLFAGFVITHWQSEWRKLLNTKVLITSTGIIVGKKAYRWLSKRDRLVDVDVEDASKLLLHFGRKPKGRIHRTVTVVVPAEQRDAVVRVADYLKKRIAAPTAWSWRCGC